MQSMLRIYVESLFDDVPRTKEIVEIREEILQNVTEKYQDLLAQGKTKEEAYQIAVSGIGDIEQIFQSLGVELPKKEKNITIEETKGEKEKQAEERQNKSIHLFSDAIMLYILALLPVIIADELFPHSNLMETIGICLMFILVAVATRNIILYNKTKPKSDPRQVNSDGDRTAEHIYSGNNSHENSSWEKNQAAYKSIKSTIFPVTLAIYFVLSFLTGAWHVTWLVFLISIAVEKVIRAYFEMKD